MKANHSPELNTKLFETNLLIYDHMTTNQLLQHRPHRTETYTNYHHGITVYQSCK